MSRRVRAAKNLAALASVGIAGGAAAVLSPGGEQRVVTIPSPDGIVDTLPTSTSLTTVPVVQGATDRARARGTANPRRQSQPRASRSVSKSLGAIAQCESGGDPRAVSPSGKYRGKYQADSQTWGGYGGYATADQAPEHVQDQWAAELQRRRGNQPWPTCG